MIRSAERGGMVILVVVSIIVNASLEGAYSRAQLVFKENASLNSKK
jgi:hypothetical protein